MQKLQQHMPEMKAIQTKYKDDKQRQQQEMMKFYKENNVNPFASCLPLVAQLPVFISLFYMLREDLRTEHLSRRSSRTPRHGTRRRSTRARRSRAGRTTAPSFLFIPDLTNKATGRC